MSWPSAWPRATPRTSAGLTVSEGHGSERWPLPLLTRNIKTSALGMAQQRALPAPA